MQTRIGIETLPFIHSLMEPMLISLIRRIISFIMKKLMMLFLKNGETHKKRSHNKFYHKALTYLRILMCKIRITTYIHLNTTPQMVHKVNTTAPDNL